MQSSLLLLPHEHNLKMLILPNRECLLYWIICASQILFNPKTVKSQIQGGIYSKIPNGSTCFIWSLSLANESACNISMLSYWSTLPNQTTQCSQWLQWWASTGKHRCAESERYPSSSSSYRGLFTYYVSQSQGFLDPPSPLRQLLSAFARCYFCTTIFDIDFFALLNDTLFSMEPRWRWARSETFFCFQFRPIFAKKKSYPP